MKQIHRIFNFVVLAPLVVVFLLVACTSPPHVPLPSQDLASEQERTAYVCGGAVEARAWQLWDTQGRNWLKVQQVQGRLLESGDTYALYDIQVVVNNLQAMAQRCGRTERLIQMADDLMPVFDALVPLPGGTPNERAWLCRGGTVCNERNHLVNTEVMLVSVQGLGFLSTLARDLATSTDPNARAHPIIGKTVQTSLEHLHRWGGEKQRKQWMQLANASASDVNNGSSALFFTDKPMWQMVIYFNLAGIAATQPQWFADVKPGTPMHIQLAANIAAILRFFESRVSLTMVDSPRLARVQIAGLDVGFWRLFGDNRFAGYNGATPPAECVRNAKISGTHTLPGKVQMQAVLHKDARDIPAVNDLGWDFSHARRLVQFFEALAANRHAIQVLWGIPPASMPSPELVKAFAAQLLVKIWNGDARKPLFSNYWSGANGWYRVAYDNGTGTCYDGYKPHGLSDSFITGGFVQWRGSHPLIGVIGENIYALSQSNQTADIEFIKEYYPGLVVENVLIRNIKELSFISTLVYKDVKFNSNGEN